MNKKEEFLQKINEAFAKSDIEYILNNVTDDIRWIIKGENPVRGKESFSKAMREMEAEEPFDLTINNIITHGNSAAVDGSMKSADGKIYAFCDVYKLSGFKNPKIREMTSYVVEVKEDKFENFNINEA